ncbi:glycosyltransferase [Sagittula salina]|uniref:Glycosyltransferase n=1 Tax=Sagittula salina TaxID=2820268 RepID=A0A940MS90_9RHOB|nr:glycosyltransferase [Sagittula salina]MBP0483087.1 glycosyltransferase [Sagittula salina]
MPDSTPAPDFARLRRTLVELCGRDAYLDALLALEDSGLAVAEAPELWHYLERQLTEGRADRLARVVRARLAEAGSYSTQAALADAQAALDHGDPHRAETILRAVFGSDDLPPPVARVMARALAGTGHPEALLHLDRLSDGDSDMALLKVDTLRAEDRLLEAQAHCELFARQFGGDARFQVRLARMAVGLGRWDEALRVWETLCATPGFPRSVALANRIRLLARLERNPEAHALTAEFLLEGPALPDLVTIAATLGMTGLMQAAIADAVQRESRLPLPEGDWPEVCGQLLDLGRLGQVARLASQGLPVGPAVTETLAAARRVLGRDNTSPATPAEAARLQMPDALLPFPPFYAMRRPALIRHPDRARILLVNASLGSGGAERQFVMMVQALLRQGIRPDQIDAALFSVSPDRGRAHFLPELQDTGIRLHDLQSRDGFYRRLDPALEDTCQLLPKPLRGDVVALHDLVAELRPDILHGWQDRAGLAAGFVGAHLGTGRIVLSARNMQPAKRDRGAQIDDRRLYAALCALPNVQLTANSIAGARDYEDWLGLDRGAAGVLMNGLDTARFAILPPRAPNARVVRLVGVFRFAPNKRPLLWLDTVRALQRLSPYDVRPRMVGSGPLRDEILAHASAIGLKHLQIDGGLSEPAAIYGPADVILLMSRVEGTPNVLLEAQAMGIAAAGCDVGGVREAMLSEGPAAGLVLPEDIASEDAARLIQDWLPTALAAPGDARAAFIRDTYSLEALGSGTLGYYGLEA